jgi:hypothetical protein
MTEETIVTREAASVALACLARSVDGRDDTERALRLLERVATRDEAGMMRALLIETGAVAVVRGALL